MSKTRISDIHSQLIFKHAICHHCDSLIMCVICLIINMAEVIRMIDSINANTVTTVPSTI